MLDTNRPLKDWQLQVMDRDRLRDEKGWQQHADLTPADRVALIEHLRMMWHGQSVINARIPRVFELAERAQG